MVEMGRKRQSEVGIEDLSAEEDRVFVNGDVTEEHTEALQREVARREALAQTTNPPSPESLQAVAPSPRQQLIPLRVFLSLLGKRWDQYAGFAHHAKKQKMGPRSVQEWRQAMADFHNRPVR